MQTLVFEEKQSTKKCSFFPLCLKIVGVYIFLGMIRLGRDEHNSIQYNIFLLSSLRVCLELEKHGGKERKQKNKRKCKEGKYYRNEHYSNYLYL